MKACREQPLEFRAGTGDKDLIQIAISSEAPVERYFGREILDHSPEAVDLSRLADNRHPLLLNHDTSQQVGRLRDPVLGEDRILRAATQFSRSSMGQEIKQDVLDEIRSMISVGYEIHKVREELTAGDGTRTVRELTGEEFAREMRAKYGENFYRAGPCAARGSDGDMPTYRVVRWLPFEASVVPIPADPGVGVGRAAGAVEPAPAAAPQDVTGQAAGAALDDAQTRAATVVAAQPKSKESVMPDPVKDSPADLERARVKEICDLGEQYSKYVDQKTIAEACRAGWSVDQFKDAVMARMESRHSTTREQQIGMTGREIQRYSLGRAIVASITGNWEGAGLEREASRAVAKLMGKDPEGFFVPFDAFQRDFNVGTSTEAGNLVATDLRTDLYVDALRNAMVMAGLGIRILPGLTSSIDIPRKSVASTLGMLTEIGSASETNPNVQKVTLSPKRVGAYVEYSKQALIQSSIALESMLRDDLLTGAAVLLEYQMINGAGTGAEIRGVRNVSGIGTVVGGSNGLAPAWSHFVDLESACANANAEPDRLAGYLVNTKTRGKAKQTTKSTYLPWIWDNGPQPLNGYRAAVSNNVPSNLTKGTSTTICSAALFGSDWSMAVLGLFGAPDVTVDPYTKADTGQVKITLNQFADMQVRQPACFAKIDDLLAG